jgi:hypothetical protein
MSDTSEENVENPYTEDELLYVMGVFQSLIDRGVIEGGHFELMPEARARAKELFERQKAGTLGISRETLREIVDGILAEAELAGCPYKLAGSGDINKLMDLVRKKA